MANHLRTMLALAKTQLKRSLRDPITSIVLFGIPILLLLVFGALLGNTNNIKLRVAVINESNHAFAEQFTDALDGVSVLTLPEEQLSFDEARDKMKNGELDGIVSLPSEFGNEVAGEPRGTIKVYYDTADTQTGDIVASVMRSIVDESNQQITGTPQPIAIERESIGVNQVSAFDNVFAMFTGMAVLMVGVFGVASSIPADKKSGILRRLHVTPLKSSQLLGGTMIAFGAIALIAVAVMTLLAVGVFNLTMHGDWLTYGAFMIFATVMMLGFGLAIASLAKNSTQADILGQVVFLASLAVSGVWFPRALMPELLQNITFAMPLTPVIDGIREIVGEGATLAALGPELLVIAVWSIVLYGLGVKLFRWS